MSLSKPPLKIIFNLIVVCALLNLKAQNNSTGPQQNNLSLYTIYDWEWAKTAACYFSQGQAITTDHQGNVYVVGIYTCDGFKLGNNTLKTSCGNKVGDMFVVKYSPQGNVIWANTAGGNGRITPTGITVDGEGKVTVIGYFQGGFMTFNGFGMYYIQNKSTHNLFIARYDFMGNPMWSNSVDYFSQSKGLSITQAPDGGVYISGSFLNSVAYIGNTSLFNQSIGNEEGFIARVDKLGDFVWVKQIKGKGNEKALSVSSDTNKNLYFTGFFDSDTTKFDNSDFIKSGTGENLFLGKLDYDGNLLWKTSISNGSNNINATAVSADVSGNVIVAGHYKGKSLPIGSLAAINTDTTGKTSDVFVCGYSSGGTPIWVNGLGSEGTDVCTSVSAFGDLYVTGNFYGKSITHANKTIYNQKHQSSDIFLAKFNKNGLQTFLDGAGTKAYDVVNGVSTDALGKAHITGWFGGDFIVFGKDTLFNSNTNASMFVAKTGTLYVKSNSADTTNTNNTTTAINKFENETSLRYFPTPIRDVLNIQISDPKAGVKIIQIYSVTGTLIREESSNKDFIELELRDLNEGIYLLRVSYNGGSVAHKIIKE